MDAPAIDEDTVEHAARLARIDLDEDQRAAMVAHFQSVLEHFETLDDVPAEDRDPPLTNVLRPDRIAPSLDRERALENAAETESDRFRGPNVS